MAEGGSDINAKSKKDFPIFSTPIASGKSSEKKTRKSKSAQKGRTPSGQALSFSYESVRNFFQDKESPIKKRKRTSQEFKLQDLQSALCDTVLIEDQGANRGQQRGVLVLSEHPNPKMCDNLENTAASHEVETMDQSQEEDDRTSQEDLESLTEEDIKGLNERTLAKKLLQATTEEEAEEVISKYPKTMDVMTVLRMFHEVKSMIEENTKKMEEMQNNSEGNADSKEDKDEKMKQMMAEISTLKKRNRFLNGHLCRTTSELQEVKYRVEQLESNAAKRMLIITGMHTSDKKAEYMQQVDNFFTSRVNVRVEDAFLMGNMTPRNIVVTFQSIYDKKEIFRNMDKFKDLTNKDGKKYGFKDFLTAPVNEKRRHENNILSRYKKEPDAKQEDMETGKGGIYYKQKLYVKKIQPLTLR